MSPALQQIRSNAAWVADNFGKQSGIAVALDIRSRGLLGLRHPNLPLNVVSITFGYEVSALERCVIVVLILQ